MYFLSDVEHKLLIHKILPTAREVDVSPQLRGWNWHQSPLKPYHDSVTLPMYSVASKYCPTNRDVYHTQVNKEQATYNFNIALGKMLHGAVSDSLQAFIQNRDIDFDSWTQRIRWEEIRGAADKESLLKPARLVWNHVIETCRARRARISAEQPYASEQDLAASAAPFLIEHKISGQLLGLSGLLSIDCYDYMKSIMFDLKVEAEPKEWHRLAPVGYALVFESVHEVPVDICCVLYLSFRSGKLAIKKDLFFANDELRNWWIQERDQKLEIVAEKKDPGKPAQSLCPLSCIYYRTCWDIQPEVQPIWQHPTQRLHA